MRSDLKHRSASSTRASPLIPKGLKSAENPRVSSSRDRCFKENININKSETMKLSAEPLQMKRKKREGGYNLRKSLAWDRAFFTEEGVLDPMELSTISTSRGERLFVIDEEVSGRSCYTTESSDVQPIENDLLKELQDEDLDVRKSYHCLTKSDSSVTDDVISTSTTSQKVISTCAGSKSGSKCGDSPRPLPSPSPANINAGKTATNELKLLNISVLKSGPRVNYINHQITEPVVSIQRNTGSKRSFKNLRNTVDRSKAGYLRPSRHSKGNLENSLHKGLLSITKSPLLINRADNSGSKMISDNMVPFSTACSSEARDEPTAEAIAHNACISGRNLHSSQNQATRPSGLRMPSPSLAFFSQPKASVSYGLSWRNTDSNICGLQKLEDSRSQNILRKISKTVNSTSAGTSNGNRVISSRSGSSALFNVGAVSREIIESNMKESSMKKVGMKDLCDTNKSEPMVNTTNISGQIQGLLKQNETEKIISQEDVELQKNDNAFPVQTTCQKLTDNNNLTNTAVDCPGNCESFVSGLEDPNLITPNNCWMLDTGGSETKPATDEPHKGQILCKFLVSKYATEFKTQSRDVNDCRWQNPLTVASNLVETCMQDCHEPPMGQTDQLNRSHGETDQCPDGYKHILLTNGRASVPANESQEYGSYGGNVDFDLESRENNMKSSCFESMHQHSDLSKEAATRNLMTFRSCVGETQLQGPEDTFTVGIYKNINHISLLGANNKQSGNAIELQNVSPEVERTSPKKYEVPTNDWLFPEKQQFCTESQQELTETLPIIVLVGEDGKQLLDIDMDSSQAPAAVHNAHFNISKKARQLLIGDTQFNYVENAQSSESHSILIDMTSSYDGLLTAKANYLELNTSNGETESLVVGDGRLANDNGIQSMRINESKDDLLAVDPACQCLSNSPYKEKQTIETGHSSLFSKSMVFEEAQKGIPENATDFRQILDCYHENHTVSSGLLVKVSDFGVNKQCTGSLTEDLLVQSSFDNRLNESCIKHGTTVPGRYEREVNCFEQSGHSILPSPVIVVEDLVHSNDGLHLINHSLPVRNSFSDEPDETSVLESMMNSVEKPSDPYGGKKISSNVVQKSSSMHETCRDPDGIVCQSRIQDAAPYPLEAECSPDHRRCEVFQDSSTSVSTLHLKLDSVEDKAASASVNEFMDDLNEKSQTFLPPRNAVPFSDEWLAAIEAAGEDILTMKSGAVQNSPPDKSHPEPNPWSPVKKKTNQIGPYDCTKFTTITPTPSDTT